jgi:2-dehydro-3-deoxyphosphooctonate aldolase (KDO 8-P synthase)
VAGIFIETHQDPDNAPSDGPCMLKLDNLEKVLIRLKLYDKLTKEL